MRLPSLFKRKPPKTFTMMVDGAPITFDVRHPQSLRFFLPRYQNGGMHEPAATAFLLRVLEPGGLFLDVGANLGYFSMVAARRAKAVYAVEAQERMVSEIRKNAELNGFENVEAILAAAGAAPALVAMPSAGRPNSQVATPGEAETVVVPVLKLGDYFAHDMTPTVMKVDVEGFELEVLRGAEAILRKGPALFIELHQSMADYGAKPRDVLGILQDHGYTVRTGAHRRGDRALREIGSGALPDTLNNRMIFCEQSGKVDGRD